MIRFIKIIVFVFCCLLLSVAFTECSKQTAESDIVVLLGTESYVKPLSEFMIEDIADDFESHYGSIPEGYIPPNVEGEYLISPTKFHYSNIGIFSDNPDIHLRITNQHNRIATVELDDRGIIKIDTAYLMGKGPDFTLYFSETREMNYFGSSSQVERCVIIKGEKSDNGIKHLQIGLIILKASQSSNPWIGNFQTGDYFIYYDGNYMSDNCDWFDNQ